MKKAVLKTAALILSVSVLIIAVCILAVSAAAGSDGHNYDENGFCTDYNCGACEPATETTDKYDVDDDGTKDTVYEISNAGQLYWFAQSVNRENPNLNGILTNNIDLNPGFTFTFVPDTGLVSVSNWGHLVGYFGTGIKGDPGGDNALFDEAASNAGRFYYYDDPLGIQESAYDIRRWFSIGCRMDVDGDNTIDNIYYAGNFNGNGKTVSGVCVYNYLPVETPQDYVGLFGQISEQAKISDLGVVNSLIIGGADVGGVCGYNNSGRITNCYNTGMVIGASDVGGVCGYNNGNIITNCYNTGSVTGMDEKVGGVCGYNNGGTVTNCYNTGDVTGIDENVGGVCGYNYGGNIMNCYNTGDVIGYNHQVGAVCGALDPGANINNCYYLSGCATDPAGEVQYGGIGVPQGEPSYDDHTVTEGVDISAFAESYVTMNLNSNIMPFIWYQGSDLPMLIPYPPAHLSDNNDCYEIGSASDLLWFAAQVNNGYDTICGRLTEDIDLNPGYTFTFINDTGLVRVAKNGTTVGYFGTNIAGDSSGANTDFDTNESLAGGFYLNESPITSLRLPSDLNMWTPIGYGETCQYNGVFDGNGKTVKGLYFNETNTSGIGLFGRTSTGARISKLGIVNSYIAASNCVGGVCGYMFGGEIRHCYTLGFIGAFGYVGGVCGQSDDGRIANCYTAATVYGSINKGAICGTDPDGTGNESNKCYYLADFENPYGGRTAAQFADGGVAFSLNINIDSGAEENPLVWYQNLTDPDRDAFPRFVKKEDGGNTVFVNVEFDDNGFYRKNTYSNTIQQLRADFGWRYQQPTETTDKYDVNDDGTKDTVYEISNAGQLFWFAEFVKAENGNGNGKLMEDINLNPGYTFTFNPDTGLVKLAEDDITVGYFGTGLKGDDSGSDTTFDNVQSDSTLFYNDAFDGSAIQCPDNLKIWGPIAIESVPYKGVFDGSGKTVSGVCTVNTMLTHTGFFGVISEGATVSGLGIINSCISGNYNSGGVCSENCGTITNCYISDSVTVIGGLSIGGVCGINDRIGTLDGCYNYGTVSAASPSQPNITVSVGGVCGENREIIRDCHNSDSAAVSATDLVNEPDICIGGVCGASTGSIEQCYNTGSVSVIASSGIPSVGGVCGENSGSITKCYNSAAVSIAGSNVPNNTYIGGVCGRAITSDGMGIGDDIIILNCYNTGALCSFIQSDSTYIGGVCGIQATGRIENCFNIGSIRETGSAMPWIGGVCADDNSNRSYCYYNDPTPLTVMGDRDKYSSAAQLSDGSIAWELNIGNSTLINSRVWSQGAEHPVFADETHKPTYRIVISGAKSGNYYTDDTGKCAALETLHGEGISVDTVYSDDASHTADAAITGVTPTVTDSIRFTYDVKIAKDLIPTLDITFGGKTVTLTATGAEIGDYSEYNFVFDGILPQQMTENIAAKLMVSNTQYAIKSQYSVKAYAFRVLPSSNDTLKAFLVNMLYYGAAAQRFCEMTENLATDGLDALLGEGVAEGYRTNETEWGTLNIESKKDVSSILDNEIITWKSATLVFDNTITMRLRFTAPESAVLPSDYTFESSFGSNIPFGDAVSEATVEGITTYYIDITGFTPTDYETVITVTLYDNNETPSAVSETATYSVMSYIGNKKDSERMSVLVRALYDYGVSGKAYNTPVD